MSRSSPVLRNGLSAHLQERGEMLRGGTIVDATLIAASPSTQNKERQRAPEMRSSKKGNQWYFGMKANVELTQLRHNLFRLVMIPRHIDHP